MTSLSPEIAPASAIAPAPGRKLLPLLLLLFVGSGIAALIYEVVWFQLLEFVIGGTAISLGVLLGTFMGGMCIGSLLFSRLVPRRFHPLRVYAALEAGIGMISLLLVYAMPVLDRLYVPFASPGASGVWLRAAFASAYLLPPTILMGATLPAIARWVESSPRGVSWLGFFYGGNTAGAVVGCLLSGFVLLKNCDMATASYVAVAINLAVALGALGISFLAPRSDTTEADQPTLALAAAPAFPVYLVAALSGASALGAEVVWTRLLSLLLGGTVYTFSLILAVFLFGLGIGSSAGAAMARWLGRADRPRVALAWAQVLCSVSIAWTAYAIGTSLPEWTIYADRLNDLSYLHRQDLLRCLWAVLLPTLFWGASFPLALAAIVPGREPGRAVGRLYAANTVGAIAGALAVSLWMIPAFGTQTSQRILLMLPALSAAVLLVPRCLTRRPLAINRRLLEMALCLLALSLPATALWQLSVRNADALPWKLACFGRYLPLDKRADYIDPTASPLYIGEGLNSTVGLVRLGGPWSIDTDDGPRDYIQFHVSGKVEASNLPQDMRLQRMLGHFPALFHPKPEKILVVGCGAGVTAGTFIRHPAVRQITICEIEPLIPEKIAPAFGPENNFVVTLKDGKFVDPRVTLVYDDARHFILASREKYDIITSDPIHPWVKGAATLYSREYFEMVKAHLNPGGLVTQWVPLYESSEETVKSEVATFLTVFPNATVWANDNFEGGYDVILLGSNDPYVIDESRLFQRYRDAALAETLANSGFVGPLEVLKTYAGNSDDLAPWLAGAQINEDRNLRLQYLAGESLNRKDEWKIRENMGRTFRFPETGLLLSPEMEIALRQAWNMPL
jgi:spermidine synthase